MGKIYKNSFLIRSRIKYFVQQNYMDNSKFSHFTLHRKKYIYSYSMIKVLIWRVAKFKLRYNSIWYFHYVLDGVKNLTYTFFSVANDSLTTSYTWNYLHSVVHQHTRET